MKKLLLFILIFLALNLKATDCDFPIEHKNGKEITKSESITLKGDKGEVYITFSKHDSIPSFYAISFDVEFKNCNLQIKLNDGSIASVIHDNISKSDAMYLELIAKYTKSETFYKIFETKTIKELVFFDTKKKKANLRVKLNKSDSKLITERFRCFTKKEA